METLVIKSSQQLLAGSPNAPLDPNDTVNPGSVEAPSYDFEF